MSTVKANAYLDSSGGTTATINGITPINAAGVAPAVAATAAGAVGSFLFGSTGTTAAVAYGSTLAGSILRAGSLTSGGADTDATGQLGTWRCLGYQAGPTTRLTMFVRIA